MSPVRFHVEPEVSVLHPIPINLCLLQGCAFADGKWVVAHEVFHFPAFRFPLPILFCLPPSCRASPRHRGGWGKGGDEKGKGRDAAARGALPSRPRRLPAATGAVPSAPAGQRAARSAPR